MANVGFVIVDNLHEWDVADVRDFASYSVTLFFIDWIKSHKGFMNGSPMKYLDYAILAFENSTDEDLDKFAEKKQRLGDGYRKQYRKMYKDAIAQAGLRFSSYYRNIILRL